MKDLLAISLLLAALTTAASGSPPLSCDQELLPELSFKLGSQSLSWPSDAARQQYMSAGRLVPRNTIATRVQIYKDEAIVAMPRFKPGVPVTLGVTSLKAKAGNNNSPGLVPFPSWAMQEEGNCEALQSVVDVVLDAKDLLWALDVGVVNTLDKQPVRRCAPKVVAIHARTKRVCIICFID